MSNDKNSRNVYFVAYCTHVLGAVSRKIDFLLTYEEWYQIWFDSGHIDERGTRKGKYVMARFGDTGPYAVGNVKIITMSENIREAHTGKTITETTKKKWKKSWQSKQRAGHVHTEEQHVKMILSNHSKWSPGGCFYERKHSLKMAKTKRSKSAEEKATIGAKGWATRRKNIVCSK